MDISEIRSRLPAVVLDGLKARDAGGGAPGRHRTPTPPYQPNAATGVAAVTAVLWRS
ncbi:hypothetical protein ACIBIZ_17800 [Nonomuraea spiralis]|uniref:hypothetical protein n=1 Tax=Nonomuraea spiralis TaxID=46182 RepID=UPI00379D1460